MTSQFLGSADSACQSSSFNISAVYAKTWWQCLCDIIQHITNPIPFYSIHSAVALPGILERPHSYSYSIDSQWEILFYFTSQFSQNVSSSCLSTNIQWLWPSGCRLLGPHLLSLSQDDGIKSVQPCT